jgi:hypothetical protein
MSDPVSESDVLVRVPLVGYLTYREWHALVDGFYVGVVDGEPEASDEGYEEERHYWRIGWLLGAYLLG